MTLFTAVSSSRSFEGFCFLRLHLQSGHSVETRYIEWELLCVETYFYAYAVRRVLYIYIYMCVCVCVCVCVCGGGSYTYLRTELYV